jgi:HPt (histidine-containing phosphotransfer) domain-containing protein
MEQTALAYTPTHRLEDATPTGDPAALGRLRRWGGTQLVHDLVQLFVQLAPTRIDAVRSALAAMDAEAAEAAAHALGSSCGQLGAMRMQRLSIRIERLAGGRRLLELYPLLAEIEDEYACYMRWLAAQDTGNERVA